MSSECSRCKVVTETSYIYIYINVFEVVFIVFEMQRGRSYMDVNDFDAF